MSFSVCFRLCVSTMGNTLATDTIPVLCTMVDVHNPKYQASTVHYNPVTGLKRENLGFCFLVFDTKSVRFL